MNPSTDLAVLPLLAKPNKLCVLAYSALIGELLFIAINTASQISYAVSITLCVDRQSMYFFQVVHTQHQDNTERSAILQV